MTSTRYVCVLALLLLAACPANAQGVPGSISYQGKLTNALGQPVPDGPNTVQFKLYENPEAGIAFWTSEPESVTTIGGVFTASIQPIFATDLAGRTDVWLEVWAAVPPDSLVALYPRVKLASTPFALRAADLVLPFTALTSSSSPAFQVESSGGVAGWFIADWANSSDAFWVTNNGTGAAAWLASWNPDSTRPALQVSTRGSYPALEVYSGSGLAADFQGTVQMTGFTLAAYTSPGYVLTSDASGAGAWQAPYTGADRWSLTGNAGTVSGTDFLGTTDSQPVEFRANNNRVLLLKYATHSNFPINTYSANVIGGYSTNGAWNGVVGGTVGGGGAESYNVLSGNHYYYYNTVTDDFGTVAGGMSNTAGNGDLFGSTSNASYATVGGGYSNMAKGMASTVPGGYSSIALGDYSFAAGRRAYADYAGSFVWGDSTDADIRSGGTNTFVARASGGTWFWSNSTATTGVVLYSGNGSWSNACDRALKEGFAPVEASRLLDRLASMPVQTWNYKSQDRSVRHIGPTAQDFAAAFNVGEDDKHISSTDADGVSLAAIQALYKLIQDKDAQIKAGDERAAALEARLAQLEKTVAALAKGK